MILPLAGSESRAEGKSSRSPEKNTSNTRESAFLDPNGVSSANPVSNAHVSTMLTSVTSSSTSFLKSPVCDHTSSNPVSTGCYAEASHPFWDSAAMGESIASVVSSSGKQLVPQGAMTGVSIVIAFPNTNGLSTSYVTSGNYLAVGMVAQSQDNSVGQDYANFAMVYLTSSGQPMIIGEVWTLPDGQCGSTHLCPEAIFDWASGWTCDCYTSTSFTKMITLTMQWNYCATPCSGTLDWKATVDGVEYTLFSYTPVTSTAQRIFHVGSLTDQHCNLFGVTGNCYYEYFQFGAMFYANPNAGWNAYLGSPKYFDMNNNMWRSVQLSTTTLGPDPPDVPAFDYAYWIGGDGFSVTNALDGCSNSGTFPASSTSLIADQLVIHPGGLVKGKIWDNNCPTDIYAPTSSFTSGPQAGSWQNSAFTLSVMDQDAGTISAAPRGVVECFYSVESLVGNSWVPTHTTSVRKCSSTISITVGSSGDCQTQGGNSCRTNIWSEDYMGNLGGTTTFMMPSDGDSWTEGNFAFDWSCSLIVAGSRCGTSPASQTSIIQSQSVWAPWSYSSGGIEDVEMNFPSGFTAGWDTTKWGSKGSPPEVFAYVKSSDTPYAVQFIFSTSAQAQFLGDVLPEGVVSDNGLEMNDGNWHLFQYAFGPYGDPFVSGPGADWSNINQVTINFQYSGLGFASGNNFVDGVVFLNPSLTKASRSFSIDWDQPSAPSNIAPNGISVCDSVYFAWNAAYDAGGVSSYTLQVDTSPSFPFPMVYSGIASTSISVPMGTLTASAYYSRVEAIDVVGNVGLWSNTLSFVVPSICMQSSASLFVFNQGTSAAVISTIKVSGSSSFSGPVSLSLSYPNGPLPSGLTAVLNTNSLSLPPAGTATVSISLSTSAPGGTFRVEVDGKGYPSSGGVSSASTIFDIQVLSPLAPSFTFSPATIYTNQPVTFLAAVSGGVGPYIFSWDFGDSSQGSGLQVSHTYSNSGTFWVTLFVKDAGGNFATSRQVINVPTSDFSVSANPISLSIPVESSGTSTITVNSLGGLSGTVTLSASITSGPYCCPATAFLMSLSPSTTQSFNPSTTVSLSSGGSASSTLTMYPACGATPPGSYTVTVAASMTNPKISHTVNISVTVTTVDCGGGGSVAAGTLITLADGSQVPVQNLSAGMHLLSYDITSNQYVVTTITRFVTVTTYNQMVIKTTTGKPLIVDQNPAQKVYTKLPNGAETLMSVTELKVGYDLFDATHQTWVPITQINYQNNGTHTMYDIYTTTPGNYIANDYLDPVK